jgi:phospholipase C
MTPMRSVLFLLAASTTTLACSSAPGEAEGQTDDAAITSRAACSFQRGDKPSKTLPGATVPAGTVDKIVVLMQENRSFDHYFGQLNAYVAKKLAANPELRSNYAGWHVDGAQAAGQDDGKGGRLSGKHAPELCHADTNHEWYGAHEEYAGGKLDGFFLANDHKSELGLGDDLTSGQRALDWYDDRDLPFYYDVATTFGIGDRYFSSLLGPTFPNRDFLYSATSRGITYNWSGLEARDSAHVPFRQPYDDDDEKSERLIFDRLQKAGISWDIYTDGHVSADLPGPFPKISPAVTLKVGVSTAIGDGVGPHGHWGWHTIFKFHSMDEFYSDAKNGNLPHVAFVDPNLTGGSSQSNDEHPPSNIQLGEDYVRRVSTALMQGKDWNHTALFVTWDENGGIYDHVTPPKACAPDNTKPTYHTSEDIAYSRQHPGDGFDQYGFRVPVLVISPWVKAHHVSHVTYDHTSILRFIETRFDLPALSGRDANADNMVDFFDFSRPTFPARDDSKGWAEGRPHLASSGMDRDGDAAKQRVHDCAAKYTHGK